jgi:hypothetical protein
MMGYAKCGICHHWNHEPGECRLILPAGNRCNCPAQPPDPFQGEKGGDGAVTGRLLALHVEPGSADVYVLIEDYQKVDDRLPWLLRAEGGTITFNGQKVTTDQLLQQVMQKHTSEIIATVHPRQDRYGASTDAEFNVNS